MGARYLDGRGTGRGPIEPTFSRLFSPPTPIFSARWCLTLLEPLQGYRASPARFAWWPVGWGVRMAGFTIWHRGSLTTEGKQQGGATTPAPKSCAALRGIETRTACSPHPGNWKPAIVRRPFGGLRHLWRTIGVASRTAAGNRASPLRGIETMFHRTQSRRAVATGNRASPLRGDRSFDRRPLSDPFRVLGSDGRIPRAATLALGYGI